MWMISRTYFSVKSRMFYDENCTLPINTRKQQLITNEAHKKTHQIMTSYDFIVRCTMYIVQFISEQTRNSIKKKKKKEKVKCCCGYDDDDDDYDPTLQRPHSTSKYTTIIVAAIMYGTLRVSVHCFTIHYITNKTFSCISLTFTHAHIALVQLIIHLMCKWRENKVKICWMHAICGQWHAPTNIIHIDAWRATKQNETKRNKMKKEKKKK